MKFFTLPALLAAALFSTIAAVPFSPLTKEGTDWFALEVSMATSTPGVAQTYYDRGSGWSETDSIRLDVQPSESPNVYRLPLPAGTYRGLRFDPLDRAGIITLASLRVVARNGKVVRSFALSELTPAWQIQSLQERGGQLVIATIPQANDPQLLLALNFPLVLQPSWLHRIAGLLSRGALVFFPLTVLFLLLDRLPALRHRSVLVGSWLVAQPCGALMIVSAVSGVASSYPVVFLGKSFVSPNQGVVLLYEAMPTLPGYHDAVTEDVNLADIGAIMWSHLPMASVQARALFDHGEWPLWNRYNSAGVALLGQGQSIFGEPLHWIVLLSRNAAWAWDVKFLTAKWLLALGTGLCVWLATRHLGAALILAAVMPFNGHFLFRVNHPAIFSMCYAPWILACWLGIVRAGNLRGATKWVGGLMLANWAEMNSGTVKEAYMSLLTLNLAGVFVLGCAAHSVGERVRRFLTAAAGGFLFVLISSPVWLTFLDALQKSYTSYTNPVAFQVQPSLAIAFFDEILFRPYNTQNGESYVLNGSLNFIVLAGFLAFLVNLRRICAERVALGLALATTIPISIIFGFIPPDWITGLPFLGNVTHTDNSFFVPTMSLLATLAGYGFAAAARRLRRPEGRGDIVLAAVLLLVLVGQYFAFGQVVQRGTFSVWSWGTSIERSPFVNGYLCALLVALSTLTLVVWRSLRRGWASPATILLIITCTITLTWRLGLHVETGFADYVLSPRGRVNFHAASPAVEAVRAEHRAEPGRFFGFSANAFHGWMNVYGLEGVGGPDPLINRHYRELQDAIGLPREWDWRIFVYPEMAAAHKRALDFLNVRHYFALSSDVAALGRVLTPVSMGDLDVYRSESAWPRAFFTDRIATYHEATQLGQLVRDGDGRPFAAMQATDERPQSRTDLAGRIVSPATNYRFTSNTTSFDITAPTAGLVVLTEAWLKDDFRVLLDGKQVPYLRVNHAFKGVWIAEPGLHRIEFEYRPRFFALTVWVAAGGLLALVAIGVALLRTRGSHPTPVASARLQQPASQTASR